MTGYVSRQVDSKTGVFRWTATADDALAVCCTPKCQPHKIKLEASGTTIIGHATDLNEHRTLESPWRFRVSWRGTSIWERTSYGLSRGRNCVSSQISRLDVLSPDLLSRYLNLCAASNKSKAAAPHANSLKYDSGADEKLPGPTHFEIWNVLSDNTVIASVRENGCKWVFDSMGHNC